MMFKACVLRSQRFRLKKNPLHQLVVGLFLKLASGRWSIVVIPNFFREMPMSMCNNLQYIPHMLFSYLRCNCGKERQLVNSFPPPRDKGIL